MFSRAIARRLLASAPPAEGILRENIAARIGDWHALLHSKLSPEHAAAWQAVRRRYEELRVQLALLASQRTSDTNVDAHFVRWAEELPAGSPARAKLAELQAKWQAHVQSQAQKERGETKAVESELDALHAQKLAALGEGKEFLAQLEQDMAVVRSYVQRLEQLPPYDTITLDDYFALFPEIKERIYAEIQEDDDWGHSQEPSGHEADGVIPKNAH